MKYLPSEETVRRLVSNASTEVLQEIQAKHKFVNDPDIHASNLRLQAIIKEELAARGVK